MNNRMTHLDEQGRVSMVDVSNKESSRRTAIAVGFFHAQESTLDAIMTGKTPKGECLAVARIAGIQAAKQTDTLIPLCHPLPLEFVEISFDRVSADRLKITSTTTVHGRTGIEMEALSAVSVAALTLWDMTKGIDNNLSIEGICLLEKTKA